MTARWQQAFAQRLRESEADPVPPLTPRAARLFELPGKVDAVIGMRRVGKSWFLRSRVRELLAQGVGRDRILCFDFEDEQFADVQARDLVQLEEAFYALHPASRGGECWFFFDEIQEVPGWEKFVRRLAGNQQLHLTVTGSSARLLSHEIATSLRGRALTVELLPFSFREFAVHRRIVVPTTWPELGQERSHLLHAFEQFMTVGGFPEVQGYPRTAWRSTLQSYLEIALLRDVAERHAITNLPALRFVIRRLLRCVGSPATPHAVYQDLRSQKLAVAREDVYAFFGHIEDARLMFFVPLHTTSERRRQMNPKKVYAIDHGLVAACVPPGTADFGHHLENLVYLELRRRGDVVGYHRTASGREVDFVFRDREGELHLVQACADLGAAETRRRELDAMAEAMREVRPRSAVVVTLAEDAEVDVDGGAVAIVPAWRWLLTP